MDAELGRSSPEGAISSLGAVFLDLISLVARLNRLHGRLGAERRRWERRRLAARRLVGAVGSREGGGGDAPGRRARKAAVGDMITASLV